VALLEKAAGQGHAYAMQWLGIDHHEREEYEQAVAWFTKGAEAGLPQARFNLGILLEEGTGVAAPDCLAAADWYRRAAETGHGRAANNLSVMYTVGRGWGLAHDSCHVSTFLPWCLESNSITRRGELYLPGPRARRHAQQAGGDEVETQGRRECNTEACFKLAACMYGDCPYAREVGRVGDAAGDTTSAVVMEWHDIPPDVMTGVVYWVRKGGHEPLECLDVYRRTALEGAQYCCNDGCEVVGHLKDFKVCPQCKTARHCGDECQARDWYAGGHKATCGTFASKVSQNRAPAE